MAQISTTHQWVELDDRLAEVCERIDREGIFGLDIEFMRVNTYFPKAGLYQVSLREEVFLVDALAIRKFDPFVALLASDDIIKVVHGGGEDLEVMRTHLGVEPRNLFDTQLAAAMVGYGWSVGYASLVKETLGIALPKDARRSDWLVRPLSEEQIRYGVQDVAYLLELHRLLDEKLEGTGRRGWMREEIAHWFERDGATPESYYLKIGGARGMRPRQLAILRALCHWREEEAMRHNLPRQWVVRDAHLLRFSRVDILDNELITRELPKGVARRFGRGLQQAFTAGQQAEDVPEPIEDGLREADRGIVKQILAEVAELAVRLEVPAELLGRRRDVQRCVSRWRAGERLPNHLSGWRRPILEPVFVRSLGIFPGDGTTGFA